MKTTYLGLILLAFSATAVAQITLTGTSYFQSFNTLDSGLPEGWTLYLSASESSLGTAALADAFNPTPIPANTATSGGVFRNIPSFDATERAFGWRPMGTSTVIPPYREGALMFSIKDTIGFRDFTLTVDIFTANNVSLDQSYWLEFRVGDSGSFVKIGSFTTGASSSVVTLTADPMALISLNVQPDPVYFRVRGVTTTGTGNLDTLGIDNFGLSYATAVPESASFAAALGILSIATALWIRRRAPSHLHH